MAGQNYTPIDNLLKNPADAVSSVSTHKEAEPQSTDAKNHIEIHEVVEHHPETEVVPYVSHRKEVIEVPPDLQKMGVAASGTPTFSRLQTVKIPLGDDKVLKGLHAPITSSFRWLAELCVYLLKNAHITIKQIHGKIVRTTN